VTRLLHITALLCLHGILHAQHIETILQQGHELAVLSVAMSPDSNFAATGSRDKSAKLWDLTTGREVRSFLGHDLSIVALSFTPDGKTLITGSNDKTIHTWNVETGKEQAVINVNYRVTGLAVDPASRYYVVSGYQTEYVGRAYQWDDSVAVIDLRTNRVIRKIDANPDKGVGYGVDVAISPDGKWMAVGEDNHVARVYQTSDWKQTQKFEYGQGSCGGCGTRVAFSADSKFLFMGSNRGSLKKYDVNTGTLMLNFVDKIDDITSVAASPDGRMVALATEKAVTVYNSDDGRQVASTTTRSSAAFRQVRFTNNSKHLIVCSDGSIATKWNYLAQRDDLLLTGILNARDRGGLNYDPNFGWQASIAKYVRLKNTVLMSNDGKSLVKGKFGTKVKRWDVASGKTVMEYIGHKKAVLCYDLSKDGRKLLTGGGDGKIILWDFDTGDSIKTIASYREPILDIRFSPDEKKAVSCGWDAVMKIHDLSTGVLETYVEFETSAAYNVMFHPNGNYIISSRLDNSIQLWEIDTKTSIRTFVGHTDNVSSIRLSPDQQSILTASWDGTVRVWNIATALADKKLRGHSGAVHIAIYGNDGKQIYSAGADRVIRVWDVAQSRVVRTFAGHRAEVTSLCFSPDQKMLVSHSVDGVTKFWDLATGNEFFEHIHFGDKDWMVKSPEGYFNGTDGARQHIHFVDGMKTYAVDQFFDDFYRPDLLPKMFQDRGGAPDQFKGIQGKLQSSPPPAVRLAIVPSSDASKAELLVRITNNGGGAENLKVFQNGKSLGIDRTMFQLPPTKGTSVTVQVPVTLVGGNNVFTASVSNRDRVDAMAMPVEVISEQSAKTSTCYLLAVGINQYKNPRMSLNYARPDAESFIQAVDKGGTLYKSVQLHTLYDTEASRANIIRKLDELAAKVNPEDVFIFYYAGHGSMVDNQFFFIPTESLRLYDLTALKSEAIEASILQEKLRNIKALKQLIIMDACQSGASVELLATRGAAEEKAIAQLSRSAGIHVMASAGSEQFATEFAELGHGLFTFLLIKALEGDADGSPKDGKVTIYELKSYLDDQVPEMTRKMKGKPQYPYTFSRGQDFPVIIRD
jgi:WD40 repeat protein